MNSQNIPVMKTIFVRLFNHLYGGIVIMLPVAEPASAVLKSGAFFVNFPLSK
jgi:hypothetical protein